VPRRIAVAGFAPFGAHAVNPAEAVVRALAARDPSLATAVLPVSYRRAEAALAALLAAARPDALLLLGRYEGEALRLERVALNLDDADAADEDGERRSGTRIRPDGPAGHRSSLPLAGFAAALERRAVPFVWSRDAGGFLCNHVFWLAREWCERSGRGIPCGFLHLPPFEAVPFERQLDGVVGCLEVLRSVGTLRSVETLRSDGTR
jgi:pyroglutamyl-peptidase